MMIREVRDTHILALRKILVAVVLVCVSMPCSGEPVHTSMAEKALRDYPDELGELYFNLIPMSPRTQFSLGVSDDEIIWREGAGAVTGEVSGYDYLGCADPVASIPGDNQRHVLVGSKEHGTGDGQKGDAYILGDWRTCWYAGRTGDDDNDFAYVRFFDVGHSTLWLNGTSDDYVVAQASDGAGVNGTAIFNKKQTPADAADDDLIAWIAGVDVSLIDLQSAQFTFVQPPSATTATRGIQTGSLHTEGKVQHCLDADGNIYHYSGSGLSKYSADGSTLWTKVYQLMGAPSGGMVYEDGDLYLTGTIMGGPMTDIFAWKIDAQNGVEAKKVQWGGSSVDNATSMASDNSGHIYVGGSTGETTVSGLQVGPYLTKIKTLDLSVVYDKKDWGTGSHFCEGHSGMSFFADGAQVPGKGFVYNCGWHGVGMGLSTNSHQLWVAQFDDLGTQQWFKEFESSNQRAGWCHDNDVDSEGNIYVVGSIGGPMSTLGDTYGGNQDAFITKYAPDGSQIGIRTIGTDKSDQLHSLAIDNDILYVAGMTRGDFAEENAGETDLIVLKLDADLNVLAQTQIGSEMPERPDNLTVNSGYLLLSGVTMGSLAGPINTANLHTDAFLLKLDTNTLDIVDVFDNTAVNTGWEENPALQAPQVTRRSSGISIMVPAEECGLIRIKAFAIDGRLLQEFAHRVFEPGIQKVKIGISGNPVFIAEISTPSQKWSVMCPAY